MRGARSACNAAHMTHSAGKRSGRAAQEGAHLLVLPKKGAQSRSDQRGKFHLGATFEAAWLSTLASAPCPLYQAGAR